MTQEVMQKNREKKKALEKYVSSKTSSDYVS